MIPQYATKYLFDFKILQAPINIMQWKKRDIIIDKVYFSTL